MRTLLSILAFSALCGLALANGGSFRGGGSWGGGGSWVGGAWGHGWKHGGGGNAWGPSGRYWWPSQYNCRQRGCFKRCPNPKPVTAWEYISTNPELTFLTKLLQGSPLQPVLEGPFDLTILAPTDEAFDKYFNTFSPDLYTLLGNDPDRTGPYWKIINTHFWPRLLSYHALTEAVYAKDLSVGTWYDTLYSSANASPHKVYFGSKDVPIPYGDTVSKYAKPCRSCKSLKYYLLDEQNKETTIKLADKFVKGGGVIQVINGVLNPSDIFTSTLGAMKFQNYTGLIGAIDYVAASAWSDEDWRFIETTPATWVAPSNEAFAALLAALGGQLPSPSIVKEVLNYHGCPLYGADVKAANLLYTPFTTGINPCVTVLGVRQSNPALKLQFKDPPPTVVSVVTGQAPLIVDPDYTTPLAVSHGINSVLLPPGVGGK